MKPKPSHLERAARIIGRQRWLIRQLRRQLRTERLFRQADRIALERIMGITDEHHDKPRSDH